MLLSIITIFPEMFDPVIRLGIIGKAVRMGILHIKLWNPRAFGYGKHQIIDDRPYGGGPGMLMMIKPLKDTINYIKDTLPNTNTKVIYLSPQGKKLNQQSIYDITCNSNNLILVCGRYQGIDERLITMEIDEEWSIGDYILSGGEIAAMVVIDTISRMLPGVLGNRESMRSDSFTKNQLLDCPHYTKPEVFDGIAVPKILLSGNHRNIDRWRLKQSLGYTWIKRPDLLNEISLTEEEEMLLSEFQNEYLYTNTR